MRAAALALACAALVSAPALAGAETDSSNIDFATERAAIAAFQEKDQRLQDVGWRLVRGNASYCDKVVPAIGLQLQDTASYGRPDIAQSALGLTGAFAVQTAARGSPAALAGGFTRNREVVRIAGIDPNSWQSEGQSDWRRLTRAHDLIDASLSQNGEVSLEFSDGTAEQLEPVPACGTRFELAGDTKQAVADGSRVVIGARFPGFAWPEDDVFAGVIAHELAHNLLGHRSWLDRNGRKRRHVRLTEREADRLIPWLLANAGYDPKAAVTFMTRWGKKHSKGLFRSRAYEGWDERAEHIAAELPLVAQLLEEEGQANWSVHFRREIDPRMGLEED